MHSIIIFLLGFKLSNEVIKCFGRISKRSQVCQVKAETQRAFVLGKDLFISLPIGHGKCIIYAILPTQLKGSYVGVYNYVFII